MSRKWFASKDFVVFYHKIAMLLVTTIVVFVVEVRTTSTCHESGLLRKILLFSTTK